MNNFVPKKRGLGHKLLRILGIKREDGAKFFVLRLLIFMLFYSGISFFYSSITTTMHGYEFANNDAYFTYLLFPLFIIFIYLRWKDIKSFRHYGNSIWQTIVFLLLFTAVLFVPVTKILEYIKFDPTTAEGTISQAKSLIPFLIYYTQIIFAYIFLFLGIFNFKFVKKFKAEVLILLLVLLLYMFTQVMVEFFWSHFSYLITYALAHILPLFTDLTYTDMETFNIRIKSFNVFIGPPCAGIYSISTFIFLYLTTLALLGKYRNIDPFKALMALLVGVIAVFGLNIVRVAIIVLVGGFYSEKIALELFHEYLSAIFLISIFILYLYFIIPRVLEKGD